jgi:hypothetical protein
LPIIFKPEENKKELLMEYENVTQTVLQSVESDEQPTKQSFIVYLIAKKFV